MSVYDELSELIQKGKVKETGPAVQAALDSGVDAQSILDQGLLVGMAILGEKFKNGEVFVPEVMIAAKALNEGTAILKPILVANDVKPVGKVVILTVEGDLHDIGKNLVKLMMEGVGFESLDLGADVSAEKVINAVKDFQPDIVAMSAMLTTTMAQHKVTIDALEAAGLRDKVKIMVGGTPMTEKFAKEIGADAYTIDAASAADAAVKLVA